MLKLISSIHKKNSAFCMKTSYFMNKYTSQVATLPGEPFCSQSPSKFQHFTFFGQNLTDVPIWSTNLKLKLITIIVAGQWFF